MNPVVTPVKDGIVKYELTQEDLVYLRKIRLTSGEGTAADIIMHEMCIMQAVAALTTEAARRQRLEQTRKEQGKAFNPHAYDLDIKDSAFTDHPICVSEEVADALISQNDREDISPRQRASLKKIIPDILNTCPVKRTVETYKTRPDCIVEERERTDAYRAAEARRSEILDQIVLPRPASRRSKVAIAGTPFAQAIRIIREAAAVYYVETEKEAPNEQNTQAGNDEPQSGGTGGATQQA